MAGWELTGTVRAERGEAAGDAVLSVSAALELASKTLDAIPSITMVGEVAEFNGPNPRSGHCYFKIKDKASSLDAIIWKGVYEHAAFELKNGMKVQFTGKFNVYKAKGSMSFVARSFALVGEGLLRQQMAELAEKLSREGLMDPARKRAIPAFCTRVAMVTSRDGKAIGDVRRTLVEHNPLVELMCVDSLVQGPAAPAQLIDGLRRAAAIEPAPDCILLVRGGGSYEDLMTYNDEALVRAVAACPVPVVTGIGHEFDTTICDMVADRRTPTPTFAALSVAPSIDDLANLLTSRAQRFGSAVERTMGKALGDVGGLGGALDAAWSEILRGLRWKLDMAAQRPCLTSPAFLMERRHMELEQTSDRLGSAIERGQGRFASRLQGLPVRLRHEGRALLDSRAAALSARAAALDALSPLKVLGRGYAIAYGEEGVATSASAFSPGDRLRVRLADGDVLGTVAAVETK